MAHIKNPEAYYRAKDSNIKMNASKGRLTKWLVAGEDHQELYDWLKGSGEYADVEKDTHPARAKMFNGDFGSFLMKLACNLMGEYHHIIQNTTGEDVEWWGSLSEKQTEVVRKSLARAKENVDKCEERKAEWAAESANREYVGEVGDKQFEVKGTISFTTSWENDYGITHLTVIRDADDNSIKYKGKRLGSKGDTVEMIATIKAHEVYNDERQTIVNRPRKIEIGEES